MTTCLIRWWPTALGLALGAMGGHAYHALYGCATGSCGITADPLMSTLFGAAVGGLALDHFRK